MKRLNPELTDDDIQELLAALEAAKPVVAVPAPEDEEEEDEDGEDDNEPGAA